MDKGHKNLIKDITDLLDEAVKFEFHDFKNEKYDTPKMELVMKLDTMINNAKTGIYDNQA